MASTLTLGPQQQRLEGRTVRDIVEHDPAQVNESWCRKIFRQLLQSLELQYAMRMPHRAITPDTVVFHENGEPLLIPTEVVSAENGPGEAADLTALAAVVHYAITRELTPAGPLRGRAIEGYSDSLISAVDRCMSPDPDQRPRSIDELRHILGIVSLGPAMPAAMPAAVSAPLRTSAEAPRSMAPAAFAAPSPPPSEAASRPVPAAADESTPSFMREAGASPLGGGLSRWQRWAVAAGGAAVLAAIALAVFAELRDSGSYDHIVLTLPQAKEQARYDAAAAPPPLAQADKPAPAAEAPAPKQDAIAAMGGRTEIAPERAVPEPEVPERAAAAAPAAASRPAASSSYKLHIKPWGILYVDGVDRGVSPPVKRLVLTPGKHTIRVANPNFHDRVLDVDTSAGNGQIAVNFNDAPR